MNGALEHATRKKGTKQTDLPVVLTSGRMGTREPAAESIAKRSGECHERCCANGNPLASIAFAYRAMGPEGREMFWKRSVPELHKVIWPFTNAQSDLKYATSFAHDIGLDRIFAYARSPAQEDARETIEAMEKCAREYPEASVAAKYFIKEHFVLAAMMMARQHFKERRMGNYVDRATAAIDKMRSAEMGPYCAQDMRDIIKDTPKEIF